MLKKRIAKQSEKQISERSENYKGIVYDDHFVLYAKQKKPNRKEFRKNENNKYLNNKQLESKQIKERFEKQKRKVKNVNDDYKKIQHSSSIYFNSQDDDIESHDSKMNRNGFKTLVINQETKFTRSNLIIKLKLFGPCSYWWKFVKKMFHLVPSLTTFCP